MSETVHVDYPYKIVMKHAFNTGKPYYEIHEDVSCGLWIDLNASEGIFSTKKSAIEAIVVMLAKYDYDVFDVLDLCTGEWVATYVGITAKEAVRNAYAQARKDFSTWDYDRRYPLDACVEGEHTVAYGDYCTRKEGRRSNAVV